MGRKCHVKTEAVIYLFNLKSWDKRNQLVCALENILGKSRSGQVIGCGTSFYDQLTYTIEISASDQDKVADAIEQCCKKMKIKEYEVVWADDQ